MKRTSRVALAPAFMGFVLACATAHTILAADPDDKEPSNAAVKAAPQIHENGHPSAALPDIGTKMPDGRVYAGLSMQTGKPSYTEAAGRKMPDGTIYAGISPDSKREFYTTTADAPGVYTWSRAVEYCQDLSTGSHNDWRVPTISELAVQFINRADIGGFNETGRMQGANGYYWSSLLVGENDAWGQRFNDGFHEDYSKDQNSSLRCVR